MRTLLALLITATIGLGLAWPAARSARQGSSYTDSVYGFSIGTPPSPRAGQAVPVTPVILSAPPENGFASNVNVIIQRVSMSRKAYRDLSVRQFEQLGYRVNAERNMTVSGRDAILFDYEGSPQGKELRFLTLAVIDTNRVFVITGTALRQDFKKYEPWFRASIQSFKIGR